MSVLRRLAERSDDRRRPRPHRPSAYSVAATAAPPPAGGRALGGAEPLRPYRAAFDAVVPHARQVADPFHVVRLGNDALDEVRRRPSGAARCSAPSEPDDAEPTRKVRALHA